MEFKDQDCEIHTEKSGRKWEDMQDMEDLYLSGLGDQMTEEDLQRCMEKREQEYYQLLKPFYSSLSEEHRKILHLLVVVTDDTRFGRTRIDETRLTVWDIMRHIRNNEEKGSSYFESIGYKFPHTTPIVRAAVAVWFFERWMKGEAVPLAAREAATQAEVADMLPADLGTLCAPLVTLQ